MRRGTCLYKPCPAVYIAGQRAGRARKTNSLRQRENHPMKHAYIPRTTTYNLNPEEELNDLRMSDQVRPLYEHVKKFIRETVDPMSVEFKIGRAPV